MLNIPEKWMDLTQLTYLLTEFYNEGYHAGHEDTVEGCYINILPVDMQTIHLDVVMDGIEHRSEINELYE